MCKEYTNLKDFVTVFSQILTNVSQNWLPICNLEQRKQNRRYANLG